MNQEQLNAIKERVAKATPEGWECLYLGHSSPQYSVMTETEYVAHIYDVNDAEFIAFAREDVPALVAEVERLQALIKELACDTAENTAIFLRKVRGNE